jgi:hypothetical protein
MIFDYRITFRLNATMNRPQRNVPSKDSTIRGMFINPWAASRTVPKPEVKTETLVSRPISRRLGKYAAPPRPRNGQASTGSVSAQTM